MLNLNEVNFAGRLAKDPVAKLTSNGKRMTFLTVVANRSWKNEAGNVQEVSTYVDFTTFNQQAEFAMDHLKKGMEVFIKARIDNRVEKVGETNVRKAGFTVNQLSLVSRLPKKEEAKEEVGAVAATEPAPTAESGLDNAFDEPQV